MLLSVDQVERLLITDWMFEGWECFLTSAIVRSSSYFHLSCVSEAASLIMIKKRTGPRLLPWGAPHVTLEKLETI